MLKLRWQVLEMNKAHFAQSLEELQHQHSADLVQAAERTAANAEEVRTHHAGEMSKLQEEMRKLQTELEASEP